MHTTTHAQASRPVPMGWDEASADTVPQPACMDYNRGPHSGPAHGPSTLPGRTEGPPATECTSIFELFQRFVTPSFLEATAAVVVIWGVLTHPPKIIQKTTQKIPKIFQNRMFIILSSSSQTT
eukprot:SAG11_NODE_6273_length_1346_cov_1.258220_2_plen_122_part_01